MTLVCRQCSRVNPADAAFCYWDGAILAGGASGGPINAGSALFPSHFIFPGGQACRNFDQLATTCQQHWSAAVDLLKQGFFSSFLGGLGRADLAMAANEAAKYPDSDRGLDQLLAKLPTQVLQPPKVKAEPSAINLGVLPMGTDRNLDLHLSNLGMRLAYGSISSDCKWLTFGDGPGSGQKLFQFGAESTIPVHVKGQFLRAGNQALEGHLVVDSNGGTLTVTVKVDVPITPFGEGVLAGCLTPRQIAERARAQPKEAAALFEKGLVSQWFTRNGWTYPVQGPSVAGLGGVQQFFEALGLARAPRVELKTPSVQMSGDPGQALTATIDVATSEKKHVFAFAVSDQHWVVPGTQPKQGKTPTQATIPLTINVPGAPGQTLHAKVTVTANGNQKFTVPLTLAVSGSPGDFVPPHAVPLSASPAVGGPVPIMATPFEVATPAAEAMLQETVATDGASPFAFGSAPTPLTPMPLSPGPAATPFVPSAPMPAGEPVLEIAAKRPTKPWNPFWFHLVPMGVLALLLLVLMFRDLLGTPSGVSIDTGDIDKTPRLAVLFDYGKEANFGNTLSFGLYAVDPQNPKDPSPKNLTFDYRGRTNSVVVQIDGADRVLGKSPASGKWLTKPVSAGSYGGLSAMFQFAPEPIVVTQTVQIMPGEAFETAAGTGVFKRPLNNCLAKYKIENRDSKPRKVGLRVLIDTKIGFNDGVPFTIPGDTYMVSTFKDFKTSAEVPDFIQAIEQPSLEKPGTVAQMNLKLSKELAPDRVTLTHWPGVREIDKWEVPVRKIDTDSAIVLYWNATELKPGEQREMAFSYGLGNLKGGNLGLTVGGTLALGREMTVVAYVAEPQAGEQATLALPKGFELIEGSAAAQAVPAAERGAKGEPRPSPITWRVRPGVDGRHTLTVTTTTGLSVSQPVTIRKKGIF